MYEVITHCGSVFVVLASSESEAVELMWKEVGNHIHGDVDKVNKLPYNCYCAVNNGE